MLGNFLNKIGVTQDDEPIQSTPVVEAKPEVKITPGASVQNASNYSQAQAIISGASNQTEPAPHGLDQNILQEMILNNFKQNPDFVYINEFLKVHDSLATIIVDESTRFKAAVAASKLSSLDISSSAGSYVPALEQEKTNFANDYIASSESDIKLVEDSVVAVTAKIQELSDQITELAAKKNELETDLGQKKAVLAYAKIDFETVVTKISNYYNELVAKINKYTAGV